MAFHKVIQTALSLFTTTYFSVRSNWKYSCGLRTFPVPTKIIFNAIRNNSGLVIFICEKHLKRFRQLRNISGFHPGKFQKVSRTILGPSKNYQACAETNLTLWCTPKQLFGLVIFICEKQLKRFRQSGTFPVFVSEKSQKLPEQFWYLPIISRHVPKPIWLYGTLRNNFSVLPKLFRCSLSPELFRCLRNFFGEFLSDSLSSIQQIDDP